MMADHCEGCSAHAHCLRSEQCACAKHTSAKQKSWLDSYAQLSGPGYDKRST